jgi:hypothetical protein
MIPAVLTEVVPGHFSFMFLSSRENRVTFYMEEAFQKMRSLSNSMAGQQH